MDIIVCLKRVPDTGARVEIEKDGFEIKDDIPWVLNPYDEFAVEEAIRIKERSGGSVTLITAGIAGGEEILKKGIAMGADSAVYIKDPLIKGLSGLGIASILSSAISKMHYDLILCGKQGTDGDYGVVGGALAAFLKLPYVSAVKKLDIFHEERRAEALREVEGGTELVECGLPALFTAHKGLNEPRYPTLPGIMRAKREEIRYIGLSSLGVQPISENLRRVSLDYPPLKRKGVILSGDIRQQVKEAVKFLRDEVKIL